MRIKKYILLDKFYVKTWKKNFSTKFALLTTHNQKNIKIFF